MINQLAFHEIQFDVINQNDQPWLTAVQIAQALGYSSEKSISNLYRRNADEFSPCMTLVINSMTNGINNSLRENEVRIFSLRGAHLIAMFSRTERAKEFRRWVLDILDAEVGTATPTPAAPQFNDEQLLMLAWLWRASEYMLNAINDVYPSVAQAGHQREPVLYSIQREYPRVIRQAQTLLAAATAHVQYDPRVDNNWSRVLPILRQVAIPRM